MPLARGVFRLFADELDGRFLGAGGAHSEGHVVPYRGGQELPYRGAGAAHGEGQELPPNRNRNTRNQPKTEPKKEGRIGE